MRKETFYFKLLEEEYPNAGFIRRWWEKKKLNIWLKLPCGGQYKTNKDFIESIPEPMSCFRCNDNGCPACDETKGSKYNPEPY